jgi:hypothetical protein
MAASRWRSAFRKAHVTGNSGRLYENSSGVSLLLISANVSAVEAQSSYTPNFNEYLLTCVLFTFSSYPNNSETARATIVCKQSARMENCATTIHIIPGKLVGGITLPMFLMIPEINSHVLCGLCSSTQHCGVEGHINCGNSLKTVLQLLQDGWVKIMPWDESIIIGHVVEKN